MPRPSVAIVGGGISGLAAAFELAHLDVPFTLYERAPRCGGVVLTERVDGYTIDAGPDALLTHKPAALALCRSLGLGPQLRPQSARDTFVVRGSRLRRMPAASVLGIPTKWLPFATTGAFSLAGKLRMAADTLLPARSGFGDESIASFIGRRFGAEAVAYLAEPLLAGIHGGDPAQLSMRAVFPRLLDLEARYGSVILGLQQSGAAMRADAVTARPPPFMALAGGMRDLTDAIEASLPPDRIRTGVGVDAIDRRASAFQLRLSTGERVGAAAVIIATPPPIASRLTSSLDGPLSALCRRIRMASVVTVALGFRRDAVAHDLRGAGVVVPRCERRHVRALSWVSSKFEGRAPADRVLLRAFLGGVLQPEAVDLSDDVVLSRALGDARPLLGIRGDAEVARVYRWRDATPQLEVGHIELMAQIERRLAANQGVFVTASGFRGTGIADCVADARAQASRAAAEVSARTSAVA